VIAALACRASPAVAAVVRGYRERTGFSAGPGVVAPLPGRPAQFLEIYLDTPYRVSIDGGAFDAAPEAVVVGPSSRHSARLLIAGPVAAFHVAFQPTGFHRLFGMGMGELSDIAVGALDLGLKPLDELVGRIRQASDFPMRVQVADDWLAHRLAWSRAAEPLDHLARLVRRANGAPPISRMAARLDLSARQLQRRFIDQVGLTPKLYARTVRFDAVLEARERHPDLTWTTLAHRFGYFDQAHLLRDAHAFTGMPPGALVREAVAMSDSS
jgi:AraC-like DNA-binding protein